MVHKIKRLSLHNCCIASVFIQWPEGQSVSLLLPVWCRSGTGRMSLLLWSGWGGEGRSWHRSYCDSQVKLGHGSLSTSYTASSTTLDSEAQWDRRHSLTLGCTEANSYIKANMLLIFYLFACLSCLLYFSVFWVWQDGRILVLLHTKHLQTFSGNKSWHEAKCEKQVNVNM